jgi:hypothetical protein
MGFKMGVSKDKLEGYKPIPAGVYDFTIAGFEPKMSKDKQSINLNPVLKVVNHPEYNGQRVFWNCNTKAAFLWNDFCHAFGLTPVEIDGEAYLPGGEEAWVPDQEDPDNIEKATYTGPMLNQIGKIEVVETRNPGQRAKNDIKQFICGIDGCSTLFPDIAHNSNLLK